jgi:antitoxin MazE
MSHTDMLHYALRVVKENVGYIFWSRTVKFLSDQHCYYNRGMQIKLRPIGNSQGIVIPKPILAQLGLADAVEAEMTVERNALVVRRIPPARRSGWAEAAKKIAAAGDDSLALGDFTNENDAEIVW